MKQSLASLGFVLLAAIAPLRANAASFDQLYVVGDSLVDPGNIFQVTSGTIPQSPPYAGRFSDGPLWVETVAAELDLSPALLTEFPTGADISEGIYAAFGGAGTGTLNIVAPTTLPDTGALAQANLLANLGLEFSEDALFIYSAGSNDLSGSEVVPAETDTSILLQNTFDALEILVGAGAQTILVSNVPDVSQAPRFAPLPDDSAAALSALVDEYNAGLSGVLDTLEAASPEVNFVELDLDGLLTEATNNPAQFGLTNTSDPCLTDFSFPVDLDFTVCDAPDEYLFWDDFHPTAAAHGFIATTALAELEEPEAVPEAGALWGMLALGAIAAGRIVTRQPLSKKHS